VYLLSWHRSLGVWWQAQITPLETAEFLVQLWRSLNLSDFKAYELNIALPWKQGVAERASAWICSNCHWNCRYPVDGDTQVKMFYSEPWRYEASAALCINCKHYRRDTGKNRPLELEELLIWKLQNPNPGQCENMLCKRGRPETTDLLVVDKRWLCKVCYNDRRSRGDCETPLCTHNEVLVKSPLYPERSVYSRCWQFETEHGYARWDAPPQAFLVAKKTTHPKPDDNICENTTCDVKVTGTCHADGGLRKSFGTWVCCNCYIYQYKNGMARIVGADGKVTRRDKGRSSLD
jgi:hypothetical protein